MDFQKAINLHFLMNRVDDISYAKSQTVSFFKNTDLKILNPEKGRLLEEIQKAFDNEKQKIYDEISNL